MRSALSSAVVMVLLFAGACTPDPQGPVSPSPDPTPTTASPTPTVSPSPSEEPSPTEEPSPEPSFTQELSEDQQEAYDKVVEYFTLRNELAKDPHSDWQPLINTVTGEALQDVLNEFGRLRTNDEKRIGDEIFFVHEVGDVGQGDEWPEVRVDMCTDSAESDIIDLETGESVIEAELPLIHEWDVLLMREHGGWWQIAQFRNQRVDACEP